MRLHPISDTTVPDDVCFTEEGMWKGDCPSQFSKFADDCNENWPEYCQPALDRLNEALREIHNGLLLQMLRKENPEIVTLIDQQPMVAEQSFDWTSAAIGASAGFVAAYALLKVFQRKNDDEFSRA